MNLHKIVLIIPPSPWLISDRDIPMYGVLYLSSYLKSKGIAVDICDLSSLPEESWFIPVGDIYGVTGVSPQFPYIKKIIEILKKREPSKPVIVGGVHATVNPQHIMLNTLADACVVGEGELVLEQIMSGINWGYIHGLYIRRDIFVPNSNLISDMDSLPFPDRRGIDFYSYLVPRTFGYMAKVKREASMITGRGCAFNCSFCSSKSMHTGKVRMHSANRVVEEMFHLKYYFGVEMINFLDDTFILDRKRVKDICEKLIDRKLDMKWFCLTRVDCVDLDILKLMKKAGCLSLAIGFETGSNRMLQLMNKRATIEQARNCIKIAHEAGLMINGQLIVGFPTETDEDVDLTVKFIKDNPEVDTFGLHVFQPFPGSDVWNNPSKYGIEINKDTDFSDYHTIGKHGENVVYHKNPVIDSRYKYLKDFLGNRSRERRLEQ